MERPLSREGMARIFSESSLPLLTPWSSPPSGRALRAALRDLYGTGLEGKDGPVITRARVRAIQEEVFRALKEQDHEPRHLIFDGTNEYMNHRAGRWARKGKAKYRRYDKDLIGLGMGTIPVLSEVTEGNRNDMKTFLEIFDALLKRLEHLDVATVDLSLVVDRSVDSKDNITEVLGTMRVVASLERNEAKELFALPLEEYRTMGKDTKGELVMGRGATWPGFDRDWRVLVTYRPAEAAYHQEKWEKAEVKVLSKVARYRRMRPHTKQKVAMNRLVDLVPKDYRGVFDHGVEEVMVKDKRGKLVHRFLPRCEVDRKAETELRASVGKTAIITDLVT